MGTVWSLFGYGNHGRTDDPDPVTGLTSRDRYLVKTSWAGVMKNPTDNGVALLILLFEKYPTTKEVFPFRDVPNLELAKNARFKVHANAVVYAVASIVDAIDNVNLLVPLLEKVGTSHGPRKVTEEQFLQLEETIVELFSTFMKKEEVEAWKKALNVVMSVINKALKKYLNEQ